MPIHKLIAAADPLPMQWRLAPNDKQLVLGCNHSNRVCSEGIFPRQQRNLRSYREADNESSATLIRGTVLRIPKIKKAKGVATQRQRHICPCQVIAEDDRLVVD